MNKQSRKEERWVEWKWMSRDLRFWTKGRQEKGRKDKITGESEERLKEEKREKKRGEAVSRTCRVPTSLSLSLFTCVLWFEMTRGFDLRLGWQERSRRERESRERKEGGRESHQKREEWKEKKVVLHTPCVSYMHHFREREMRMKCREWCRRVKENKVRDGYGMDAPGGLTKGPPSPFPSFLTGERENRRNTHEVSNTAHIDIHAYITVCLLLLYSFPSSCVGGQWDEFSLLSVFSLLSFVPPPSLFSSSLFNLSIRCCMIRLPLILLFSWSFLSFLSFTFFSHSHPVLTVSQTHVACVKLGAATDSGLILFPSVNYFDKFQMRR